MVNLPPVIAAHKGIVIFGAAGTVGLVYVLHKRKSSTLAATTPVTGTDATASAGDGSTDPSDPNSAYYDPNYSSDEYDSGDYSAAYGSTYGTSGSAYLPAYEGTVASTVPTSNPAWMVAATTALTGVGYDPLTVTEALGKYLAGQGASLTATEYPIVIAAIGVEGQPPTAVAPPQQVATATTPPAATASTVKDGYYRVITNGAIYQVTGGKRYHVVPTTWKALNAQKTKPVTSPILSNNPVMKLPLSGSV